MHPSIAQPHVDKKETEGGLSRRIGSSGKRGSSNIFGTTDTHVGSNRFGSQSQKRVSEEHRHGWTRQEAASSARIKDVAVKSGDGFKGAKCSSAGTGCQGLFSAHSRYRDSRADSSAGKMNATRA
jgi:hypothetical protein